MSYAINSYQGSGRVTRDAAVRETGDNRGWVRFGLAVDDSYKKASGETVKQTVFLDVNWNVFGPNGKAALLTKGTPVIVSGRLKQESWEKDGKTNTKITVQAQEVGWIRTGDDSGGKRESRTEAAPAAQTAFVDTAKEVGNVEDENLPF